MKRIGLYVALAASLVVVPAQADGTGPSVYGGVGLGLSNFSVNKSNISSLTASSNVNPNSFGLNLVVGMQFDPFLGMELDYLWDGAVTETTQGQTSRLFKADLVTFAATMGADLNDNVRLFSKLGATSWSLSSGNGLNGSKGFGPCVGFGADINLYGNSTRKLRLEYNYYLLDKVYVNSVSSLTINAMFSIPDTSNQRVARSAYGEGEQKW